MMLFNSSSIFRLSLGPSLQIHDLVDIGPYALPLRKNTPAQVLIQADLKCRVYLMGAIIIFATSTPAALHHNASLGGFISGMITTGIGLGGLKACVPPFMGMILGDCCWKNSSLISWQADQYTEPKYKVKTLKTHERVVTDRDMTLQSIYGMWYWYVPPRPNNSRDLQN